MSAVCVCVGGQAYLTFQSVPEAHVGTAVHGPGVVVRQTESELHLCRGWQPLNHVTIVVPGVTGQGALAPGITQHASAAVVLRPGAQHLLMETERG